MNKKLADKGKNTRKIGGVKYNKMYRYRKYLENKDKPKPD